MNVGPVADWSRSVGPVFFTAPTHATATHPVALFPRALRIDYCDAGSFRGALFYMSYLLYLK